MFEGPEELAEEAKELKAVYYIYPESLYICA